MKRTGLVLEGGGARGIFSSGALDFLMEKNLYFPYVVGVSFGACNALDYVSKQIGRTKDCTILSEECEPTMGFKYLLKNRKFIDMDRIFDKFPNEEFPFDYDTYFSSDIRCEMAVTNCLTGKAEFFTEKSDRIRLMAISRASSSLPLISPIVYLDDIPYLDGGVADSIPIVRALHEGYKKNVVILTRNPGYQKSASKHMEQLVKLKYKNYPEFIKAFKKRPYIYNRTLALIERLEKEGRIFVLRPQIPTISRTEDNRKVLTAFYNHGYDMMADQFDRLMVYLNK